MIDLSPAAKEARLTALANYVETGSGIALLRMYTGPKPTPGAAITTQTLIVEFDLPNPFANDITDDTLTIDTISSELAVATGTVAWGRILNRNGDWVGDAIAGEEDDPTAWIWLLSGVAVAEGSLVSIQTAEITE